MVKMRRLPPTVLAGVFMIFGIIAFWFFLSVAGSSLPGTDWDVVNSNFLFFTPYLVILAFALIVVGQLVENRR